MAEIIPIAFDHKGYEIKPQIIDYLKKNGFEPLDCGTDSEESCDYPDFMFAAAEKIKSGESARAIGVCYSGQGSAIAANKVKGVRAALCHLPEQAQLSRAHNDSNMLILSSAYLKPEDLVPVLDAWFKTPFEGGRHERRVNKIKSYEESHAK